MRCLLLEAYTPLSLVSAVPSPVRDRLGCACILSAVAEASIVSEGLPLVADGGLVSKKEKKGGHETLTHSEGTSRDLTQGRMIQRRSARNWNDICARCQTTGKHAAKSLSGVGECVCVFATRRVDVQQRHSGHCGVVRAREKWVRGREEQNQTQGVYVLKIEDIRWNELEKGRVRE